MTLEIFFNDLGPTIDYVVGKSHLMHGLQLILWQEQMKRSMFCDISLKESQANGIYDVMPVTPKCPYKLFQE